MHTIMKFRTAALICLAAICPAEWRLVRTAFSDEQVPTSIHGCGIDDDIWLVSCRRIVCLTTCRAGDVDERLEYWRYSECGNWRRSDQAEFLETTTAPLPTCVWVHGDRMESGEAFAIGLQVYRQLICGVRRKTPIRFVIWSWPSAKQIAGRPAHDAQIKASRCDPAGYALASMLTQLDPQTPLSLVGFSFGARVVTSALHVAAGGAIDGFGLQISEESPNPAYHVVLMASALDNDWLEPGKRYGMALDRVSQLLLVNNYCDWVLKRYRRITCSRCGEALGYTGLCMTATLERYREAICQVDACAYIGKEHAWRPYIYTTALMAKIRAYAICRLLPDDDTSSQLAAGNNRAATPTASTATAAAEDAQ
jgi:hypothetical protein